MIESIHILLHWICISWIGYSSIDLFRVGPTPFPLSVYNSSICLIQYLLYLLEKLVDGLADERMKPPRSTTTTTTTTTTTLYEVVIGANRLFIMKPAAAHVPPCEGGEMSKEQQAVVDRYRGQQATIDRYREGVAKSIRPGLFYSAEQRRAMESVAGRPVAKREQSQLSLEEVISNNSAHLASFDSFSALTSSSFASLTDFSAATVLICKFSCDLCNICIIGILVFLLSTITLQLCFPQL